jgi:signal transduction histidine kinase
MVKLWDSVAFRMALGYGVLSVGSMALIAAVFYVGTVVVLNQQIDQKLVARSNRLTEHFETGGMARVQQAIQQLLDDGLENDTEVYLLVSPDGRTIVGNLSGWAKVTAPLERLTTQAVTRNGRASTSRLLPRQLRNGATLVVGLDVSDMREIEQVIWHALTGGGAVACVLAIGGAFLFRRQLERRIGTIRRTTLEIEMGDLSRRIPISGREDEFSRLNREINRMLDQIEHLMAGVRDVSNAIAHDLRTPLCRLRGQLDGALRPGTTQAKLADTTRAAIEDIDELIGVFDAVLQIAETESGIRRQGFEPVPLNALITDVVELYDAAAEAKGLALVTEIDGEPTTLGDKNLLANAVANLLDNALKYAGSAATVRVRATQERETISIVVQDNGPGIPPEERSKVIERFYRLDQSRSTPGHGLGLAIVAAITALHRGALVLEDAAPGLVARMVLPRINAVHGPPATAAAEPERRGPLVPMPPGGGRPGAGGTRSPLRGLPSYLGPRRHSRRRMTATGPERGPSDRASLRGWVHRMTQVVPGWLRRSGADPGDDG